MKLWIVVNHDRREYTVYPIDNESIARDKIASEQQKGRNITYSVSDSTDIDVATREAERLHENYHNVKRALAPD
jgi:hypothetical protein